MENSKRKEEAKQNIDQILGDFEQLKAEARNSQSKIKGEIEENIRRLEEKESELRQKYKELETFGETAVEEIMNAIFSSAKAFSDDVKSTKEKL